MSDFRFILRQLRHGLIVPVAVVTTGTGVALAAQSFSLIHTNATWAYRKGTAEASAPDPAAWRMLSFNDGAWPRGAATFYYGESIAGGTQLADMQNSYSTLFLRRTFVVTNAADLASLELHAVCDDGFIAWINGVEVARRNVDGLPAWDAVAALHDDNQAIVYEGIAIDPAVLVPGLNLLAIQIVNNGAQSSDLLVQPALSDGLPGRGALPPAQAPDPSITVAALEVAPDPAESWVALHNPGERAVDLTGWRLEGGGVAHAFTPGTVIPADGTLHVAADARRFRARMASPRGGEALFVQGNWRGRLDDRLAPPRLRDATGRVVEAR